ncbi:unnamed protein product [Arctia plantaginis]|uniref:Glucose-methanol-choline oxidoreductase N-terminal domain-containing protein n=1 Tax=Arctia plantaginis TaxID=874455 RepID=A0A8S1BI19_ARCPL|nr:unnamed protein product [Arctia plantaginis]
MELDFKWIMLLSVLSTVTTLTTVTDDEFPPNYELRDGQKFDYIVVGAGAGGAAAAARLALAGQDVLLIEAGGDPLHLAKIPAMSVALQGSIIDWQYKTISNNVSCLSSIGQQCRFSRGKCLGGSTSINYMLYTRGNRKSDFKDITRPGWTFEDLMPYFLRYEGLQDLDKLPPSSKSYHNTSGLMRIGFFGDPKNRWHSRLINSFRALNFPFNPDVNAASQIGVTIATGYTYGGERMSTARGYLAREDVKNTLKVAKNTMCTGVLINRKNIATGITAVQFSNKIKLYAEKEVILSAGTLGTPQILMLSGIGPADHLKTMNIPVKVDLPVGDNLTDHALPLLFLKIGKRGQILANLKTLIKTVTQLSEYLKERQGAFTSNGLTDVIAFVNTHCYDFQQRRLLNVSFDGSDCEVPNLEIINAFLDRNVLPIAKPLVQNMVGLSSGVIDQLSELNKEFAFIAMSPVLLRPYSSGTVRLKNRNPLSPPAIYANYLSDERDVDEMVRSIRLVEQLTETPVFKRGKVSIVQFDLPGCPHHKLNSQNYWRCYVRHLTYPVYHAVGTVSLNTVLDERLRVLGVKRLRVADLSVLPSLPRANTEAVAVAIGERVSEMLLADNQ